MNTCSENSNDLSLDHQRMPLDDQKKGHREMSNCSKVECQINVLFLQKNAREKFL